MGVNQAGPRLVDDGLHPAVLRDRGSGDPLRQALSGHADRAGEEGCRNSIYPPQAAGFTKPEYYQLAERMQPSEIPPEVTEKLDAVYGVVVGNR